MAFVDPKLSKGIARHAGRMAHAAGRAARREDLVFAIRMTEGAKATAGIWNPRVERMCAQKMSNPAVIRASSTRVKATSFQPAHFHRRVVMRPHVEYVLGDGSFDSQPWGIGETYATVSRGKPEFRFAAAPLLVEHHAIERLAERGDLLSNFATALDAITDYLWGWMGAARALAREQGGRANWAVLPPARCDDPAMAAIDVVIPWKGGALLGGIAAARAPFLVDRTFVRRGSDGEREFSIMRPGNNYARPVVSIRTFMDGNLMDREQASVINDLIGWREAMQGRLGRMDAWLPPIGHDAPQPAVDDSVEAMLPFARRTQAWFRSYRTKLSTHGAPRDLRGEETADDITLSDILASLDLGSCPREVHALCEESGMEGITGKMSWEAMPDPVLMSSSRYPASW